MVRTAANDAAVCDAAPATVNAAVFRWTVKREQKRTWVEACTRCAVAELGPASRKTAEAAAAADAALSTR